ncbi:hypothetical protein INR49_009784 [Caranx melampygus]|nr:hypothetical protein INR49_009784 [Caranx melampygus]
MHKRMAAGFQLTFSPSHAPSLLNHSPTYPAVMKLVGGAAVGLEQHWRGVAITIMLLQSVQIIDLFRSRHIYSFWDIIQKEERAHTFTLTAPMLASFYVMVFDTTVSSEQTVKQQEHILQGVAQMVMNMESDGSHHSGSPLARGARYCMSADSSKVYTIPQTSSSGPDPGPSSEACGQTRPEPSCKLPVGMKTTGDGDGDGDGDDDEAHSTEGPPNISECGGAESLLAFLLNMLSERSRQLYAQEAACRLQATERDGKSLQRLSKEEYLKMMLPDSPPGEDRSRKVSAVGSLSPRRSLYRTLSDESVCSNRKGSSYTSSHSSMLDQAMPNDILFSTTPPYHSTLPPRMIHNQGASNLRTSTEYVLAKRGVMCPACAAADEFWFSDGSLADRSKFSDPGLMPLPDTASGLDWSHLVDAARAFEDQRVASFCTMTDMQRAEALQISRELTRRVVEAEGAALEADSSPSTLTGKVNQLEVILRQLQHDLRKEKEDKAMLQEEVQHLRQDNMRLQEESQTAAAQLRKFTEWFFHTIDKKP